MLKIIKRAWRNYVRGRRHLVIVVPWHELGDQDVVSALAPKLTNLRRRYPARVVLDRMLSHFDDLVRTAGLRTSPTSVILFAHPSRNMQGFAVNPAVQGGADILLLRWWQRDTSYDLMVAYVCRGAEILRRQLWRGTFPRWISFNSDVRAFLASESGTRTWEDIANAFVEASLASSTIQGLKARLVAAIEAKMAELWDSSDPDSVLNIMYLEESIDSLACSEDSP